MDSYFTVITVTTKKYFLCFKFSNCRSFDFFDTKFDRSSYSKMCANIIKFKSFLKNFYS
jgi:hypothetical protein